MERDVYTEIRSRLSGAALYEQLAEEAVELAHAAQKMARLLRGENPTPKSRKECVKCIVEEWADVNVCMDALMCYRFECIEEVKAERWLERLEGSE